MDLALLALRVVIGLPGQLHSRAGWSLDNALGIDWSSTGWALAALGAGLIGGGATVIAGRLAADRDDRGPRPHPA
jgi:hypothetical protein